MYIYKNFKNAQRKANKLGLTVAEYGEIYGENRAYCYWNRTGNRYDKPVIYCEYCWNNNGKAI